MPKKSSSKLPKLEITEDDVVLQGDEEGGEDQDDFHSVGLEGAGSNGREKGFSTLDALAASLTQNMQHVLETDEDQRILNQLHAKKLSLENALRLLTFLENVAHLSDEQMDSMAKIAGFPVNSRALTAYIREIGASQMTDEARMLVRYVVHRNKQRALLPVALDSRDHEVFAGTITDAN